MNTHAHPSSSDLPAASGAVVPGNRRLELLRATTALEPMQRGDGLWVVVRVGGGLPGRYQTKESAERAAAKGNVETWLRIAVNVAPEVSNLRGHVAYYAQMLVDTAGMTLRAATQQCNEWANDEALFYAIRNKATGAPHAE